MSRGISRWDIDHDGNHVCIKSDILPHLPSQNRYIYDKLKAIPDWNTSGPEKEKSRQVYGERSVVGRLRADEFLLAGLKREGGTRRGWGEGR